MRIIPSSFEVIRSHLAKSTGESPEDFKNYSMSPGLLIEESSLKDPQSSGILLDFIDDYWLQN